MIAGLEARDLAAHRFHHASRFVPGHGGHDIGTRGKVARESHIALKVALALGK